MYQTLEVGCVRSGHKAERERGRETEERDMDEMWWVAVSPDNHFCPILSIYSVSMSGHPVSSHLHSCQ